MFPMPYSEQIDIVDDDDNVIGVSDIKTAHEKKLKHRVVGVFVFDREGRLYLQKENKYGRYDLSVGGHVSQGETYGDAVKREMKEELGLNIPLTHISTFFPKKARLAHRWAIYEGIAPDGWEFTPTEEVGAIEKLPIKNILDLIDAYPQQFTYGFLNTVYEFIRVRGSLSKPI
jgi:isopentenyldiphosphate isomerase